MARKASKAASDVIRRRALQVQQDSQRPLYLFTLTGEELLEIAEISRVSRDEGGKLIGYQRPNVKQHVKNIVEYLDSGEVLFPNAVILSLSSDVVFKKVRGTKVDKDAYAEAGTLEIQRPGPNGRKPAWIVDGQQRTLALVQSKRGKDLPVPVSAFVSDDVDVQREQFLRVNSSKPLPRGLVNELLPEVSTVLPSHLSPRKAPAAVVDLLNRDPDSPFHKLIRRTSNTPEDRKKAAVADTVMIGMLKESFSQASGILYPFRNVTTGMTDFAGVRAVLFTYWSAVRDTFPDAWGLPPEQSRLMHGVGIRAMGKLMDRVMATVDAASPHALVRVRDELAKIQSLCKWTDGVWEELNGLKWNELQNLPQHIRGLTNYLVRAYLTAGRVPV